MLNRHGREISKEIVNVRRTLRTLDRSLDRLAPMLSAAVSTNNAAKENGRRLRLSTKPRASLVLQGRYMGFMRQLKPRQKALIRKVREAKGVRAAIQRARELARS